jgi:hypothetical protein
VPRTRLGHSFVPDPAQLTAPASKLALLRWLAAQRKAKGFERKGSFNTTGHNYSVLIGLKVSRSI